MSERKFKITLDEDELKAVIHHHAWLMVNGEGKEGKEGKLAVERSARIHDLTKRLNKKDNEPETTEVPEQQPQASTVSGW